MANLRDLLGLENKIIELGEIQQTDSSGVYLVLISGIVYKAHNTTNKKLSTGDRVIITRMENNKRYIVSATGFIGNYNEIKEVFQDG